MMFALALLIFQAFCAPRIAAFIVPKCNVQYSLSRSVSIAGRQNIQYYQNSPTCLYVTEDQELSDVKADGSESKLDSDWNKFAIAGVVSYSR